MQKYFIFSLAKKISQLSGFGTKINHLKYEIHQNNSFSYLYISIHYIWCRKKMFSVRNLALCISVFVLFHKGSDLFGQFARQTAVWALFGSFSFFLQNFFQYYHLVFLVFVYLHFFPKGIIPQQLQRENQGNLIYLFSPSLHISFVANPGSNYTQVNEVKKYFQVPFSTS